MNKGALFVGALALALGLLLFVLGYTGHARATVEALSPSKSG